MKSGARQWILWLVLTIVGVVLYFGLGALLVSVFGESGGSVACVVMSLVLFILVLPRVAKNLRMRRRESAQAANNVLQTDLRPPVVYLRAFTEDGTIRPAPLRQTLIPNPMAPGYIQQNYWTFEEEIAVRLTKIGPFVALAQPQQLPELGAARIYASDLTWQQTVIDLLTRCRLVIFRAGDTESLLWELRKVVELVPPERVIVFLQIGDETDLGVQQARYDRFRRIAQGVFPKPLPPERGKKEFLYFTKTWDPVLGVKLREVLKQVNGQSAKAGSRLAAK